MLNWCWPHGLWVLAARALEENARMSAPGTIERPSVQVGGDSARPASALSRYFEISLFLMLLVSVLALVSTGKLDLATILLAPTALLVKGYRWWRGGRAELSHRTATLLVVLYILYFPVDLWWVSRGLSADAQNPALFAALLAAIHLLLFAMIVRLFSASTTRDYLFLALLAFSALLASAILTVDTTFLFFFLVFLALAVSTFIGLEMRRSSEGAAQAHIAPGSRHARKLHTALGITSAMIAMASLAAGAIIFFVIPRFNAGYLSGFNLQPSLISGFSDDVELGQIGEIKKSSAVVMRIKVQGDPQPARSMHWRGIALTTFDGRRWYTEGHEPVALTEGFDGWIAVPPTSTSDRRRSLPFEYTVMLEPLASDAIFVAAEPARIRGQFFGAALGAARGLRRTYLTLDKTGSLANPFHNFADLRYDAVSQLPETPPEVLRDASEAYPESIRALYLQLPKLDARIPAMAKTITARAGNPYDKALAIQNYLRNNYGYTLDLSGTPPVDPLAYFLFEKHAGHCEYFAAAMTVMMRAVGVPTRYVNGFLPGEYNDVGEDYIIRASDAHSWVEVFFPSYGWMTFDPTPPSDDQPRGLLAQVGLYWDWFQLQWNDWVVNYDFIHQFTLAQGVQRVSRRWTTRLREAFESSRSAGAKRLREWAEHAGVIPSWMPLALVPLSIVLLLVCNGGVRERLVFALRLKFGFEPPPVQSASIFYQRMLRLLERAGWHKSPSQTPIEFAASLPDGAIAAPVHRLTGICMAVRFGGQKVEISRFTGLLEEIKLSLQTSGRRHLRAGSASR
jgi:protein-glutamine gamma-glutamyltransferase